MFRELARAVALIFSIVSLYALLGSAFFAPGSPWQTRLLASIEMLAMAGCVCFASGLLFNLTIHSEPPVAKTLPVQLFWWVLGVTALMFALSRYLEVFYVPFIWKNQPY